MLVLGKGGEAEVVFSVDLQKAALVRNESRGNHFILGRTDIYRARLLGQSQLGWGNLTGGPQNNMFLRPGTKIENQSDVTSALELLHSGGSMDPGA